MLIENKESYSRLAYAAGLVLLLGLGWSSPADAQTVGGRAIGAFVNIPTLGAGPLYLSDSGELSANGGWEGAGLLGAQVPSVLSANVLNAATSGAEYAVGTVANSSSSLADVVLLPGQVATLTASFVQSQATATATGTGGSTEIDDLVFGGVPVIVTGLANQQVVIPGLLGPIATLIINEQKAAWDGVSQTITVNALHLILATGEEVILASAQSVVNPTGTGVSLTRAPSEGRCVSNQPQKAIWRPGSTGAPPIIPVWGGAPECIDFVTGGGWFEPPDSNRSSRVNFGFNAGPRSAQNPTDIKGHLNFIDHGVPLMHVRGVNVLTYEAWGADLDHCRVFSGDAVVNGVSGFKYRATVCDYGEPGRDDRFFLEVFNDSGFYYLADNKRTTSACPGGEPECGTLDGGNIQLHKSKCIKQKAVFGRGREVLPIEL
jgi:hypothetical protein